MRFNCRLGKPLYVEERGRLHCALSALSIRSVFRPVNTWMCTKAPGENQQDKVQLLLQTCWCTAVMIKLLSCDVAVAVSEGCVLETFDAACVFL